jgi:hypothetical protein
MSRLLKLSAGAVAVLMAALVLLADPTRGWADSPLCRPTGCPSGAQLCATLTVGIPGAGSVTYYCYQAAPTGGGGTKPPVK